MDLVSHGFWTAMIAMQFKRKRKIPLRISRTVFWGMFPDLFAFVIPVFILIFGAMAGKTSFSDLLTPGKMGSESAFAADVFQLISLLYSIAHSLVVFLSVAVILWIFISVNKHFNLSSRYREFPLEIGGWALHILIDIPTHAIGFFATPFLFPLSDWKFNGLSWRTPWLLAADYILMICLYYFYFRKKAWSPKKSEHDFSALPSRRQ
ncbi:MAG: hypothetical protein WC788_07735 [Candidatus Paceibacterota bacterium]|jgi:hypothetical protein